jgi:hypothetical protein
MIVLCHPPLSSSLFTMRHALLSFGQLSGMTWGWGDRREGRGKDVDGTKLVGGARVEERGRGESAVGGFSLQMSSLRE